MKLDFEIESDVPLTAREPEESLESVNDSDQISRKLAAGIEAARRGDFAEARILLIAVSEVEPQNEDAWLWLASISQYPDELLVFLNKVLTVNPGNERALQWSAATKSVLSKSLVRRGIEAARENQNNFAEQCFRQAVAHADENESAWLWLASVTPDAAEKRAHLEKVLTINPENGAARSSLEIVEKQIVATNFNLGGDEENILENFYFSGDSDADSLSVTKEPEVFDTPETRFSPETREIFSADAEEFPPIDEMPSYYHAEDAAARRNSAANIEISLAPDADVSGALFDAVVVRPAEIEERNADQNSSPKSKKILVVDDSATVRRLISDKLEKCGHTVVCAVDGRDALEKIGEIVPDLVLLDIAMPQMDGYRVCKAIRADEKTANVPVVMISGKDGFFDKVRGRLAGATGYITKPFGPDTLMKAIESYVGENQESD